MPPSQQLERRPSRPSITAMRRKGSRAFSSAAAKAQGTDRFTVAISMICGLLGALVMIQTTAIQSTAFVSFAGWTYTLLETPNQLTFSSIAALVLGMGVMVLSFLAGYMSITNRPNMTKIFFAMLLVVSAVEIGGGLAGMAQITGLDDQIQSSAATGGDLSESGLLTRQLVDYSLAIYDSCCYQKGQFKPGDDGEISGQCNGDESDEGKVCYTSNLFFNYFSFVVEGTDVCKMLSEQTVDLSGVTLKFAGIKIDAASILGGDSSIVLVGQPNGCGRGYARAFQYLLYVWFAKTVQPLFFYCVGCGAIQVLLVCLAYASMCLHADGGAKSENAIDTYQTYMKALKEQQASSGTSQSQRLSYQRQSQQRQSSNGRQSHRQSSNNRQSNRQSLRQEDYPRRVQYESSTTGH